jgi:glucokinase
MRTALGVDIGGTALKLGLVSENGKLLAKRNEPSEVADGPAAAVDRIEHTARGLLVQVGARRESLVGVGVGCPGPMKYSEGQMYDAANLPRWTDAPLRSMLAEQAGLPVVVENDANMATWGELWLGAGRGMRDIVLLTLGTGVGSGVIVDGELLRGHFENGGELGHCIVVPGGRLCNCGQRGCIEAYSSASRVAADAEQAARVTPGSLLAERLRAGEEIDSKVVEGCAREGDATALRVWTEACQHLATAIVNIQHAFNPQRVILGGGMSHAGEFLLDAVRTAFESLTWKLAPDQPEIVCAELGNDAGMIGAAGRIFRHVSGAR